MSTTIPTELRRAALLIQVRVAASYRVSVDAVLSHEKQHAFFVALLLVRELTGATGTELALLFDYQRGVPVTFVSLSSIAERDVERARLLIGVTGKPASANDASALDQKVADKYEWLRRVLAGCYEVPKEAAS